MDMYIKRKDHKKGEVGKKKKEKKQKEERI